MNNRLKACPFCGNPDVKLTMYPKDGVVRFRDKYAVMCPYDPGCGAEGGIYCSVPEAVAAWNQRKRKWRE